MRNTFDRLEFPRGAQRSILERSRTFHAQRNAAAAGRDKKKKKKKNALPSHYAYIAEVIVEDQISVCYLFCRCTFALYE